MHFSKINLSQHHKGHDRQAEEDDVVP